MLNVHVTKVLCYAKNKQEMCATGGLTQSRHEEKYESFCLHPTFGFLESSVKVRDSGHTIISARTNGVPRSTSAHN